MGGASYTGVWELWDVKYLDMLSGGERFRILLSCVIGSMVQRHFVHHKHARRLSDKPC
jgi:hypothetical protein